jgi:hypothetical protein
MLRNSIEEASMVYRTPHPIPLYSKVAGRRIYLNANTTEKTYSE